MLTKDLQYARFMRDSREPDKLSIVMELNSAGAGRQVVSEEKIVHLVASISEQKEIYSCGCSGSGGQ